MIHYFFYIWRVHFFGRNFCNVITRLLHPPFSSSLLVVTLALAPFVALQSNERDASADTLVAKVYVGYFPSSVAVNPITNTVFVASDRGIDVVDGATNKLVKTIQVQTEPFGSGISVIDGKSNTMIKQIDLGRGAVPQYIAINSITNKIYVRDLYSTGIWIIDGSTNTVTDAISAGSSSESSVESPAGIAVNPTTNRIYAPNWNISLDPGQWFLGSSIKVIDGSNNKIVQTLPVGKAVMDVAVNPVTNRIYASDSYNHRVVVIDGNGPLENAKILIDTINCMNLKKII